ncbi:hypothetical protein ACN08P_19880 [Photobacterium leiognathi subsp. mandapamensis]|uniref:hypothetical protein n=1 Tax=Photobacterium leiognathi TaxID=553611 RepID=UPI003AF3A564
MDIKKHFEFSPNKSLIQLRVLWIVVGIISLISTICFILIYKNSNIITDITYHGFNMFIVIYRVPLSILALIIPIIALLAANHRSEQTREQIRLANDQNNFSNYYKHIEEFEKYSSKISTENKIEFKSTRKLYKKLFPNARNGDFKIKYSFMEYNGEKLKKYM